MIGKHLRRLLLLNLLLFAASFQIYGQLVDADQPSDTIEAIDPSNPTELIIAYEEASQSVRKIGNSLRNGFNIATLKNQYDDVKPRLEVYRRIGDVDLQLVSISKINDLISIFDRQLKNLDEWQTSLIGIIQQLSDYRIELARLQGRMNLDQQALTTVQNQYYSIRHIPLLDQTDSLNLQIDQKLEEVLKLEYDISQDYVLLHNRIEDLKSYLVAYWDNMLDPDDLSWTLQASNLQLLKGFNKKFTDTAWRIADFYKVNISASLQLLLIFVITFLILRRIKKADQKTGDGQHRELYQNPLAFSFLVAGLLFPVVFPPTTSLMYDFALIISYIPFLYILYARLNPQQFRTYLIFLVALVVLKVHNIFFTSPALSALVVIACGFVFIYTVIPNTIRKFFNVRWKWIVIFNWLLGLILLAGIVCLTLKRVRLGNILIIGAGETIAISLALIYFGNWFDQMIDFLRQQPFFKNLSNDVTRLNEFWLKWSNRIYLALLVLFVIAILKNFSLYTPAKDAVQEFLNSPRNVGDLSYSYGGIALFFLVIYISAGLSSSIKFFAEDKSYYKNQKKTANLAVIMRFILITVGFILALLVSGIPIDKITIILGALSVGIGFGLQNIVNNLISGVILIFERPIQTGDLVELQQYTGLVKDIGIRSSIIKTYDGAEVIVPNGNLVSQEVINWTLSNRQRRLEILVGVAYGSNANQVTELMHEVIGSHKKVLKLPPPMVLFDGFGESSIDFRLRAWTSDIDNWMQIRSDLSAMVYEALNEAGINIPFPQRDLHIRSLESPNSENTNDQTDILKDKQVNSKKDLE